MKNTYAFIDATNIIYGANSNGWKVDFKNGVDAFLESTPRDYGNSITNKNKFVKPSESEDKLYEKNLQKIL
jgi:hypothetical protein